jgi:Tol biopolymer transport system component
MPSIAWFSSQLLLVVTVGFVVGCEQKPKGGPAQTKTMRESIQKPARLPSAGVRKLEGMASDLRLAPEGKVVTALLDASRPPIEGVPGSMRMGTLWVIPTDERPALKIASGATNLPGGMLFTSDGRHLLVLGAWDPTSQSGSLIVQDLSDLSRERQVLAPHVTYFKPSDDGQRLAYVNDRVLYEGPLPLGPFRQLAGEVATLEYAPNGKHLYFRRRTASGGGVFQLDLSVEKPTPKSFVDGVGEYAISVDSKWIVAMARTNPKQLGFELFVADTASLRRTKIGDDVMRFAISRDGRFVARMQIPRGLSQNASATDFLVGELWLSKMGEPEGRKVGAMVHEFEFTKDSKKLVFRENYVSLALLGGKFEEKVGDLTLVSLPEGAPKLLQKRCPNYVVSPDGQTIAFTARIERPEYSRHLFVWKDGAEPTKLQEWLYDYDFSSASDRLFWRANCTREGRSCDLLVQDLTKPWTEKPVKVAETAFNFRLSEDGTRVITTTPHMTDESFDVAVTNLTNGQKKHLDQYVAQPVYLAGKEGTVAAWVVTEKKNAGVYVTSGLP